MSQPQRTADTDARLAAVERRLTLIEGKLGAQEDDAGEEELCRQLIDESLAKPVRGKPVELDTFLRRLARKR